MSYAAAHLAQDFALGSPPMTALRALFLVCLHHGVTLAITDLPALAGRDFAPGMMDTLAQNGFRAKLLQGDWAKACRLGTACPVLAEGRNGGWFILVAAAAGPQGGTATILDPAEEAQGLQLLPAREFAERWSGRLILLRREVADRPQPFGLRWFWPAIAAEKPLLAGAAVAVVFGNLVAVALPFLVQVIIDRVIAHHAWNTLVAVAAIYVLLVLFDAGFVYVRTRLMLLVGGRVDARVTAAVHARLIGLPLATFETTAAGVLARHMQLTEKIRHFLTGRLFQTLLDAAFLPFLLVILALLSGVLTAVVAGFALAIAGVLLACLPSFRIRLGRLYEAEADRQGTLIETLRGIRTIKALALEDRRRRLWEDGVAATIRGQFAVGGVSAIASALTGMLERLMQVAVIGVGAALVLAGEVTLGMLVAFLMLSGRVTGPFVQIVGLIQEWQEAVIAVATIRPMMDHPPERGAAPRPAKPALTGEISVQGLGYSYPGATAPVLHDIAFAAAPGQIVGIVGRSGSGKSTLARLLQGIGQPDQGRILFDGVEIGQIDLDHLRRYVGVVVQESFLFRGTLEENIAIARPGAGPQAVRAAARLAGADGFIAALPQGFGTAIDEGGSNLSGGQRQRIAIARALLADPRILILDEATSALDPESEAEVNRNLVAMAQGRTVIVVSHRMSSLVRADSIVVLDSGRVLDQGPHATLLARCPTYRHLWEQQTGGLA